jgi:hypothetical protein
MKVCVKKLQNPLKDTAEAILCLISRYGRKDKTKEFLNHALDRVCLKDRERGILRTVYEQATLEEYLTLF